MMKNFLPPQKGLLCKIGFHKWEYTSPIYESETTKRLAIPEKKGYRICSKCGKKQILFVHCLGLNPPKYIYQYK